MMGSTAREALPGCCVLLRAGTLSAPCTYCLLLSWIVPIRGPDIAGPRPCLRANPASVERGLPRPTGPGRDGTPSAATVLIKSRNTSGFRAAARRTSALPKLQQLASGPPSDGVVHLVFERVRSGRLRGTAARPLRTPAALRRAGHPPARSLRPWCP